MYTDIKPLLFQCRQHRLGGELMGFSCLVLPFQLKRIAMTGPGDG